jgi:hypothetical protein
MLITRLFKVIRRYWKIGVPILLFGLALLVVMFSQQQTRSRAIQDQAYPAIIAGTTTSEQLEAQVGKPYTTYKLDSYEIKTQKTPRSPYKPDLFYIKDDVVVMKEEYFEPSIYFYAEDTATKKFGTPERVLYDTRPSPITTKVLLYAAKGVAVFVLDDTKAVTQIQYYSPMSTDEYLRTWGKNLGRKEDIKPFGLEPTK